MKSLKEYFRSRPLVVKDEILGRITYLKSQNGNVWAGSASRPQGQGQYNFFLEAAEPVIDGRSREYLLEIAETLDQIADGIRTHVAGSHLLTGNESPVLSLIYIHDTDEDRSAELIFNLGETECTVLLSGLELVEVDVHTD